MASCIYFIMETEKVKKILLIGRHEVGKSQILNSLTNTPLNQSYVPTIGVDFKIFFIRKFIKLQIWDTAGQPRFQTIIKSYYRGCQAAIIVFALNNRQSFEQVRNYHEQFRRENEKAPIVLFGNKNDLQRNVTTQEASLLANQLNLIYMQGNIYNPNSIRVVFDQLDQMSQGLQVKKPTPPAPPRVYLSSSFKQFARSINELTQVFFA